ncbi:MAG: hypothetical protein ACJAT4_000862 [Granulosicoccus sp.]
MVSLKIKKKKIMKYLLLISCLLFVSYSAQSQFQVDENGLTIIVTDGTENGKNSEISNRSDIPTSYDQIGSRPGKSGKSGSAKNSMVFNDPIRSLGMKNCIQAAAFLDRPKFGKIGFMLIFSLNDSIGGRQATHLENGKTYKGVYRLIRQKTSANEVVPKGMTTYEVEGTFLLLGIS